MITPSLAFGRAVHKVRSWDPGNNCFGCGALLNRTTCEYCGKPAESGNTVTPDPKDDPKRKTELRKVME